MAATYILGPFRLDAETDSAAASPALTLGRSPGRKTSRTASRRLRIRRAGGCASMPTRRCRAKRHHLCSVGRNYCLRVRFRGSDAMRFRSIWAVGTRVIATATIIGVAKLVLHDNREAAGRRCHTQVSVEYLVRNFQRSTPEQNFSMSPEHARTASKPLINRSSAPADRLSEAPARARDAAKAFLATDPTFLLIAGSSLTVSLAAFIMVSFPFDPISDAISRIFRVGFLTGGSL